MDFASHFVGREGRVLRTLSGVAGPPSGGFCVTLKSARWVLCTPRVLTNDDLAKMVDTWISGFSNERIREGHIADPDMATSDMAVQAAKAALDSEASPAKSLMPSSSVP